jgi:hypothetical protein
MKCAAATYDRVSPYGGRAVSSHKPRRVARAIRTNLVMAGGATGAVFLFGAAATLAAIWITGNTLTSRYDNSRGSLMGGPGTLALASADPRLAMAADSAASSTFQTRWAGATAGVLHPPMVIAGSTVKAAPASVQMAKLEPVAPPTPLPAPRPSIQHANAVPMPLSRPAMPEIARAPVVEAAPKLAMVTPAPLPPAPETRVAPKEAHNKDMPAPEIGSRTAVYDISARTVFLPDGEKLEAHSGLYDKMDDPRYVAVRMRGPTPPNVYDLTLREEIFHGVRAIRLNPVNEDKMFGRAGMLAHTYMLGPNGQSNGCVSFKNYDRFLQAFLRGEIDRLIVVPEGGTKLALGNRPRRDRPGRYASYDPTAMREANAW